MMRGQLRPPPARPARAGGLLFLLALSACSGAPSSGGEPTPTAASKATPAPVVVAAPADERVGYPAELAAIDRRIAALRERASSSAPSWLFDQELAEAYSDRGRLTGDYDDYGAAEEALAAAFRGAPEGSGPWMARAQLHFTLHRLAAAEADLDHLAGRLLLSDRDEAAIAGLRADIAFQRGEYEAALAGFTAAVEAKRTMTSLARLATYRWKTGDHEAADELFAAALEITDAGAHQSRAWLRLMRGLLDLDRGRYREALAHYEAAATELPGYWLVDEHIAEVRGLLGEREAALDLYEDLVVRTGNPEFIDALADAVAEGGDAARAAELIASARAVYERQLARFPEAAAGHALAHFLERGDQPARALALAEANHAIRPGGDAKILLAQALLAAGEAARAEEVIRAALASPWRTAELHRVAAEVFAARGDREAAAAERAKARAINPAIELDEGAAGGDGSPVPGREAAASSARPG